MFTYPEQYSYIYIFFWEGLVLFIDEFDKMLPDPKTKFCSASYLMKTQHTLAFSANTPNTYKYL